MFIQIFTNTEYKIPFHFEDVEIIFDLGANI